MQTKLYFHGGAGSVTGLNLLLETGADKILIDCGLFQGRRAFEEINWEKFPYDPRSISTLLVTHAHVDHIGRIPKLVREGFEGRILSTEATKALAEPLLLDSMEILAHDAKRSGRELLYEERDIKKAFSLWEGIPYSKTTALKDGFEFEFINAGHILGSAMVRLRRNGTVLLVTGDIGSSNSPLLPAPESVSEADYLIIESVYGDKVRPGVERRRDVLEDIIENTYARGGTLLIPAFSTERTQDLLFEIRTLMVEKRVANMPVYLDSPLAREITAAFSRHPSYFKNSIRERLEKGEDIFTFPGLHFVEDIEESKKVALIKSPKIVVAGSGMSNGGRVREHERVLLPDKNSTLLIVGYQVPGSLGRRLIEGEKRVVVRGEKITVACHVEAIYDYSAHADAEGLLQFVNTIGRHIKQVFVVHGEPSAAATLTQRIRDYLGVRASAPEKGDMATLEL
jgi:metallo-beta-lactamase family protein